MCRYMCQKAMTFDDTMTELCSASLRLTGLTLEKAAKASDRRVLAQKIIDRQIDNKVKMNKTLSKRFENDLIFKSLHILLCLFTLLLAFCYKNDLVIPFTLVT